MQTDGVNEDHLLAPSDTTDGPSSTEYSSLPSPLPPAGLDESPTQTVLAHTGGGAEELPEIPITQVLSVTESLDALEQQHVTEPLNPSESPPVAEAAEAIPESAPIGEPMTSAPGPELSDQLPPTVGASPMIASAQSAVVVTEAVTSAAPQYATLEPDWDIADPVLSDPEDSGIVQSPQIDAVAIENVPAPVPTVTVTPEEPVKACCICGVDVSKKERSRDRAGRYWCAFCHNFNPPAAKSVGMVPCPDCGRESRLSLMIEHRGEQICRACHPLYLDDCKFRLVHKAAVTANPETELRQSITAMLKRIVWLTLLAVLTTLYHYHFLYYRPRPWVPYLSALYLVAILVTMCLIAIGFQYMRIAIRKRERQADYETMVRSAVNHILALDEDSHAMGISESPEPLRRRVERAVLRTEASAGRGDPHAGKIIEGLAKHSGAHPLIEHLLAQRPNTTDTVARNREIATISYLQVDLATASLAVDAILLRLPYDQDAMTRQALICFRNGELESAKKIFRKVVHIARQKNSDSDLAAAYCNLGMLHVMLSEFDDAANRYSQAMIIYNRLHREEGQADCLVNLGLIAYRQKRLAEVEAPFRKAMAINKRRHRREGLATCCGLLGLFLFEKEIPELAEARSLLTEAIHLNLELGRPGGVAAAYGNLGLVLVKRGDLAAATEQFHKALAIYQRINRPKLMLKIQGMIKAVNTLSAQKASRSKAK